MCQHAPQLAEGKASIKQRALPVPGICFASLEPCPRARGFDHQPLWFSARGGVSGRRRVEKQELCISPARAPLGAGALSPALWEGEEDGNLLAPTKHQ